MTAISQRGRQALLGLAIGDAISWPAMFHRSRLLPAWTRRLRREIDVQRESSSVLRVPMPFSLNQPPASFDIFPTDDTEWAAWTMSNLIAHDCMADRTWSDEAWNALAQSSGPVRGPISVAASLDNFRRGLLPPATGSDNPHYFDDGAMPRAVPLGILFAGNPDLASEAATIDASATNSEDGIYAASAIAAAISVACAGGGSSCVIDAAVNALPEESWSRQTLSHALALCERDSPLMSIVPELHWIQNVEYSDGCAAPETLALALAIISRSGRSLDQAVSAATMFAKGADALPAIFGALSGALAESIPWSDAWEKACALRGICLPSLRDTSYTHLVDRFVTACGLVRGLAQT